MACTVGNIIIECVCQVKTILCIVASESQGCECWANIKVRSPCVWPFVTQLLTLSQLPCNSNLKSKGIISCIMM